MTIAVEYDPILMSLHDESRAQMAALNQLLHPITPGDPRRIAALEARIETLRHEIRQRRSELAAAAR